tara:strand:+ start:127 stop:717 length:591 start_codon:yes stop_codon:yes gene_type:complete
MKFFILIISLFSHNLYSKSYISDFGFKIIIPDNYIVVAEDTLDETTDFVEEMGFDMSEWNTILNGLSDEKTITLYNIDDINKDFLHNINFSSEPVPYEHIKTSDLDAYCSYYQNMLKEISKKYIDQLACNLNRNPGINGNSLYMEHYGIFPEALSIQYFFWIDNNTLVTSTLTCIKNECFEDKMEFNKIISSLEKY